MVAPNPEKPPRPPETGVEACLALVDAVGGPLLRTAGNRWALCFERRGVPEFNTEGDPVLSTRVRTMAEAQALLRQFAPNVEYDGRGAPTIETELFAVPVGDAMDRRMAQLCFQVRVELVELFEEGGPLFDLTIGLPDGRVDERRLTIGHLTKAQRFLDRHLARAPFRPTIVLDDGWRWRLVYVLDRPIVRTPEVDERLAEVSSRVASLTYGGHPVDARASIRLPFAHRYSEGRGQRLRFADPNRRHNLDFVHARALGSRTARSESRPTAATRNPLELRLRTLPDGWDLSDVSLPDDLRQSLLPGGTVRETSLLFRVVPLVRALALRRHGWLDVELLLSDPRYALFESFRADHDSRGGLRRVFLEALARAPSAYPPRLPYGIRRILQIRCPHPGDPRRYVVCLGPRRAPIEIEVTYDVLTSASRFRRALGNRLGLVPCAVFSQAWTEAIALGLRDPRIAGWLKAGASASKPMSGLLAEYMASAADWHSHKRTDASPLEWPMRRDGFVVFPLKHLQRYVDARIRGSRVGRAAIAGAVRAAGGENHGAIRFGARCVRCWQLPWIGREATRTGTPAT